MSVPDLVPLLVTVVVAVVELEVVGVGVSVWVPEVEGVRLSDGVGVLVSVGLGVPVRDCVVERVGVRLQEGTLATAPAGHIEGQPQGEQAAAPAALKVEAGHRVQVKFAEAPRVKLAVPAGHRVGVADEAGQYVPAGQRTAALVPQL